MLLVVGPWPVLSYRHPLSIGQREQLRNIAQRSENRTLQLLQFEEVDGPICQADDDGGATHGPSCVLPRDTRLSRTDGNQSTGLGEAKVLTKSHGR